MLRSLILLVGSYVLGAIPSGYLIVKYGFHHQVPVVDGQMGTKYILRNVGFTASLFTFAMDFLKGYFSVWAVVTMMPKAYLLHALVILCIIIGHNYSIFLHFKGGKGIASSFGCFAGYPPMLPLMIVVHYLANELTKRHTFYGILPLAILGLVTMYPYSNFLHVPMEIRLAAVMTILLFIIKTYDDPMFLELREQFKKGLSHK